MDEDSCELAESLVLGDDIEGEALRSTLPLRALTFGERKDARLGSTGPSPLASASLNEEALTLTVEPDLPWKEGVERTVGEGAESLAVMVLGPAGVADLGRPDMDGDIAGLDAAEEGLAKADMSTRARPVPGVGRLAVGVVELDNEGEEYP